MISVIHDTQIMTFHNNNSFRIISEIASRLQNKRIIHPPAMIVKFPRALEPDNWQIVIPKKVFVYSAHLDPWSRNESIIHILGSITKKDLINPNRSQLYCKIWIVSEDSQSVIVDTSKVTRITDPDFTWEDFE